MTVAYLRVYHFNASVDRLHDSVFKATKLSWMLLTVHVCWWLRKIHLQKGNFSRMPWILFSLKCLISHWECAFFLNKLTFQEFYPKILKKLKCLTLHIDSYINVQILWYVYTVSKTNLSVHEDKNRVPYVKVGTVSFNFLLFLVQICVS